MSPAIKLNKRLSFLSRGLRNRDKDRGPEQRSSAQRARASISIIQNIREERGLRRGPDHRKSAITAANTKEDEL